MGGDAKKAFNLENYFSHFPIHSNISFFFSVEKSGKTCHLYKKENEKGRPSAQLVVEPP